MICMAPVVTLHNKTVLKTHLSHSWACLCCDQQTMVPYLFDLISHNLNKWHHLQDLYFSSIFPEIPPPLRHCFGTASALLLAPLWHKWAEAYLQILRDLNQAGRVPSSAELPVQYQEKLLTGELVEAGTVVRQRLLTSNPQPKIEQYGNIVPINSLLIDNAVPECNPPRDNSDIPHSNPACLLFCVPIRSISWIGDETARRVRCHHSAQSGHRGRRHRRPVFGIRREKAAPPRQSNLLVSDRESFQFPPSNPWVATHMRTAKDVSLDLDEILPRHWIQFVRGRAKHLDPRRNSLTLEGETKLTFDFFIIATGPRLPQEFRH